MVAAAVVLRCPFGVLLLLLLYIYPSLVVVVSACLYLSDLFSSLAIFCCTFWNEYMDTTPSSFFIACLILGAECVGSGGLVSGGSLVCVVGGELRGIGYGVAVGRGENNRKGGRTAVK